MAEKDIYTKYQSHFDIGRSYDDLSLLIFYAESLRGGEDPDEKFNTPKGLKIPPFDDLCTLLRQEFSSISQEREKVIELAAWPPPVP